METIGIKASVGSAYGEDAYAVGVNACQDAVDQLGDKNPDLLIVFASAQYDQQKMLDGVRSVAGHALLVGSSTSGGNTTLGPLKNKTVAIMAIRSLKIKYFVSVGENVGADPRLAGKAVAEEIKQQAREA